MLHLGEAVRVLLKIFDASSASWIRQIVESHSIFYVYTSDFTFIAFSNLIGDGMETTKSPAKLSVTTSCSL